METNLAGGTPALRPKPRGPQGPRTAEASREAKKLAAAILEVLGGLRLPCDAARTLSISLQRYYQLESRALSGFLSACEPKPRGRVRSSASEAASLQKEVQRLKQECSRYQALFRASQRAVGLTQVQPAKPAVHTNGKKSRKRKATVRALKAAEVLHCAASGETEAVSGGDRPAEG